MPHQQRGPAGADAEMQVSEATEGGWPSQLKDAGAQTKGRHSLEHFVRTSTEKEAMNAAKASLSAGWLQYVALSLCMAATAVSKDGAPPPPRRLLPLLPAPGPPPGWSLPPRPPRRRAGTTASSFSDRMVSRTCGCVCTAVSASE
jgi:hypothetical protein